LEILLLDDGYIILKIDNITGNNINTTILKGGILKNAFLQQS
jgi:pyruvate kinase